MNRGQLDAYLLWRTADRLGSRPWDLEGEARDRAEEKARREADLIEAALRSPEASRVAADPEVVEAAAEALGRDYGDRAAFIADLRRAGLDGEALRCAIAAELRAGVLLERVTAVEVREQEVRAYYEAHRERMARPERRAVRHILITINDDYPENRREAAFARIAAIGRRLEGGGRGDFSELARRHSECPSALQGGWIGRVARGRLHPELDRVLFGLREAEVSGIVESELGFHLLYCQEISPAAPLGLCEASPRIRALLEARERRRRLNALFRLDA